MAVDFRDLMKRIRDVELILMDPSDEDRQLEEHNMGIGGMRTLDFIDNADRLDRAVAGGDAVLIARTLEELRAAAVEEMPRLQTAIGESRENNGDSGGFYQGLLATVTGIGEDIGRLTLQDLGVAPSQPSSGPLSPARFADKGALDVEPRDAPSRRGLPPGSKEV